MEKTTLAAENPRDNNFGMIRIVGAIMVMAGHNAFITDSTLPTLFHNGIHFFGIATFLWWAAI